MKRKINITFSGKSTYRILVQGKIDQSASDILGGMLIESELTTENNYRTKLTGVIKDQADLSGILNTIYEHHLSIISLECIDDNAEKPLKS